MSSLAEWQRRVRAAVVDSEFDAAAPMLVGGTEPTRRLAIHRRHYHASLVDTLRQRFPATAWLVGDRIVTAAAGDFVVAHPPRVICMAEFGTDFPSYLAARPGLETMPYVEAFARLEWEVGRVAVAVSARAVGLEWLSAQPADDLGALRLTLQPGAAWLRTHWNVDELLQHYLAESAPDRFTLVDADRWIEVRGARGDVSLRALSPGAWQFRRTLAARHSIEEAASAALDADGTFDPGSALVHMIADGLVTGHRQSLPDSSS